MRKRERTQIGGIVLTLLLGIMFLCASATELEIIAVDSLSKRTIVFNAVEGDVIRGSVAITGGNFDIDFWITDLHGNTVVDLGRVCGEATFEFTAQTSGAYTIHFDNSFSSYSKLITFFYSTTRSRYTIYVLIGVLLILLAIIGLIVFLYLRGSKYPPKHRRIYDKNEWQNMPG